VITGIALLLFLGATGKSAQLPLCLVAGRDGGPTPVSADPCRDDGDGGMYDWPQCRALQPRPRRSGGRDRRVRDGMVAGTICLVQNDIKRVLALDGLQLGYMFWRWESARFPPASSISTRTRSSRPACSRIRRPSFTRCTGSGHPDMGGLKKALPITYHVPLATLAIAGFRSSPDFLKGRDSGKTFRAVLRSPLGDRVVTAFSPRRMFRFS
jgi:NADH-quinone oxidoreductase subunit L